MRVFDHTNPNVRVSIYLRNGAKFENQEPHPSSSENFIAFWHEDDLVIVPIDMVGVIKYSTKPLPETETKNE